jgi:hypothetical protein
MMGGIVGALRSGFPQIKAFSIAEAIVSTFKGMARALELPFPANLAAAATVAAQHQIRMNSMSFLKMAAHRRLQLSRKYVH